MKVNGTAKSSSSVICLGEILFDLLASERGKTLKDVTSWISYPGGAPANVACALTKLGTSSAFIGCVGKDDAGRELVAVLESVGVNTSGIQEHAGTPTRKVYVTRTNEGDRIFSGFGERPRADERRKGTLELGDRKSDEFADAFLQAENLPAELFLSAEYLVLGTLELAYPKSREAIFKALQLAEEYNLKIVLDVNWRSMFWQDQNQAMPLIAKLWSYVDFVKLTKEEALWLFKTADAGAISYRLGSVEGVLVTDGGGEVSYCLNDNEGKVMPCKVAVEDTTGAGDAFLAGLIHQLCQQGINSLRDPKIARNIVTYACTVGSLTVTRVGAIASQPTATEVREFLKKK